MATILVVEDDGMNRELITRRLVLEGYQTLTASNGAQALGVARRDQPDLILMDMGMPVMNGWQATRRLKAAPETEHIPIIALTAYALQDEREHCLTAGCDAYATKPVDFTQLLQTIRRLLTPAAQ